MKTWIFLRGLSREAGHWANFPELFQKAFDCEILCPDLPGAGVRRADLSPLTVRAIVENIREKEGIRKSFSLLGVSLGSMLAMEWAHTYPSEVESVVLINGSSAGLSPFLHRLSPKALGLFGSTLRAGSPEQREALVLDFITNHMRDKAKWLKVFQQIAVERPMTIRNCIRQIVAARLHRAKPLKVPTLILCGLGDRLANPKCSKALAAFFGAPLQCHPTAGHDLPLDDAEWVIEQIRKWQKPPRAKQLRERLC